MNTIGTRGIPLTFTCPKCLSKPHYYCVSDTNPMPFFHSERVALVHPQQEQRKPHLKLTATFESNGEIFAFSWHPNIKSIVKIAMVRPISSEPRP